MSGRMRRIRRWWANRDETCTCPTHIDVDHWACQSCCADIRRTEIDPSDACPVEHGWKAHSYRAGCAHEPSRDPFSATIDRRTEASR